MGSHSLLTLDFCPHLILALLCTHHQDRKAVFTTGSCGLADSLSPFPAPLHHTIQTLLSLHTPPCTQAQTSAKQAQPETMADSGMRRRAPVVSPCLSVASLLSCPPSFPPAPFLHLTPHHHHHHHRATQHRVLAPGAKTQISPRPPWPLPRYVHTGIVSSCLSHHSFSPPSLVNPVIQARCSHHSYAPSLPSLPPSLPFSIHTGARTHGCLHQIPRRRQGANLARGDHGSLLLVSGPRPLLLRVLRVLGKQEGKGGEEGRRRRRRRRRRGYGGEEEGMVVV